MSLYVPRPDRWFLTCGAAALMVLLCPLYGAAGAPPSPHCAAQAAVPDSPPRQPASCAELIGQCPAPLTDPRAYLTISWLGRGKVVAPDCPNWEVIGDHGQLEIQLDAERMKCCWEFETEGGLAIRASRKAVASGTESDVKVPGFAEVGEPLRVMELDLSAAFNVVAQISKGIDLANDAVLKPKARSEVAALKGEAAALAAALEAEKKVMEEVERALREVYTEALRFQLDDRHLREAAQAINAARTERAAVISPAAAARKARLDEFFRGFEAEHGSLGTWLQHLLEPANRPYLGIIARVTGRSQSLIQEVATEVQALLVKVGEGKLDPDGRQAAMERLVAVAEKLAAMERAIANRYQHASDDLVAWIQESPQYQSRAPRVALDAADPQGAQGPWPLRKTRPAAELIAKCMEGLSSIRLVQKSTGGNGEFPFSVQVVDVRGSGDEPPANPVLRTVNGETSVLWSGLKEGVYNIEAGAVQGWNPTAALCSDGSLPSHLVLARGETVTCTFVSHLHGSSQPNKARELAEARLEVLEGLLRDLCGKQQYQAKSQEIRDRFEAQIQPVLAKIARLGLALEDKQDEIRQAEEKLQTMGQALKRCTPTLDTQSQALQVALMKQVQDTLIDRIRPVTLTLDEIGLERGDRLSIDVSMLAAAEPGGKPPKQLTSSFLVAPRGWSTIRPTITADVLTFVKADGGDDYQPRYGISALWNFYGKSTTRKSPWRALAPGFGIGVQLLDFDSQENPVEVGVGVMLTLFDNLLQITWGRNISQEFTFDNGTTTRDFVGIGLSIDSLFQKFPGEKKE